MLSSLTQHNVAARRHSRVLGSEENSDDSETKEEYDGSDDIGENVINAINKLSNVVKRGRNALPSEETKELVDNISVQIDSLMKQDIVSKHSSSPRRQRHTGRKTEIPLHTSIPNNTEQEQSDDKPGSPVIVLPPRPTPYELWSKAHEQVTFQGKVHDLSEKPCQESDLELTKEAWANLITRLSSSSREKHVSLMRAETKAIAEDLASQSFSPSINPKSRKLAQVIPPLQQRLDYVIKSKQDKIEKQRQQLLERELSEVTGTPQTNSQTSTWKPRVQNNYTNNHSSIAEALLREDCELTFSPRINANSTRICELAYQRMEHDPPRFVVTGTSADPGHEQETFQPQINPRSKRVHRPPGKVHDRLFENKTSSQLPMKKKRSKTRNATIVNVVEYSPRCDFLLKLASSASS